jgi:hypothetical protein
MTQRMSFTLEEARRVGESIGIDWASSPFDAEQFRMGMDVELEHGLHDLMTNVTDSDPAVTGRSRGRTSRSFRLPHPPRTNGRRGQASSLAMTKP